MEPVKTELSNFVYRGDGDQVIDLHTEVHRDGAGKQLAVSSVWEPSPQEREALFVNGRVKLTVFTAQPIAPVMIGVTTEERVEG